MAPTLTIAPLASIGSNFIPLLDAITTLCRHARFGSLPEGPLKHAEYTRVFAFLGSAYDAIIDEWRALQQDPSLSDAVDRYLPWPSGGHTDLLSLGRLVADDGFLCSALGCAIFSAVQSAVVLLNANTYHPRLVARTPDGSSCGMLAGYCGGAALANVLSCAKSIDELYQLTLQSSRLGFWIGVASDRAAARQRASIGTPRHVKQLQSWAIVTTNWPEPALSAVLNETNNQLSPLHHAYISAYAPGDQYTVMGLPTTLAILERLLRQRADAEVKNKRSSRISRIPLYSPFHSRHLLSPELKATKEVVERRGIFASTAFDEKKSTAKPATLLYSTVDGQQVSLDDGPLDALLDMVYLNPSRWDHVVASVVRDTKAFVKKNPGTPVEVLNVGPGGGLGQILAQRIEHATLVDLEEQVLVGAKRAAINPVPPPGAIAIVSTAVRAPGDVKSSNDLWEVHCEGVKPQKVPKDRFRVDDYIDTARSESTSVIREGSEYGYHLSDVDKFDARLFSISPREAERLDPHHRLMLECSMEAMERAGYAPGATNSLSEERIATFFAVANDDYRDNGSIDVRSFHLTGNGRAFAAGRVSFLNRWKGPSATFDAGEMSTLAAIEAAADALRARKCDTAIVAGAQLVFSPTMYVAMDQAGLLAHTADRPIPPFASSIQGAVRGEACGALVLKQLDTAIAEGDDVQAVLSSISSTFAPVSWLKPYDELATEGEKMYEAEMQVAARVRAFKSALDKAGIKDHEIQVVECNCSGNAEDERIEVEALKQALTASKTPVWLTSIKSAFGDAEAAAGVLSVCKSIEILCRGSVPPHPKPANGGWNGALAINAHLRINDSDSAQPLSFKSPRSVVAIQSFSVGGGNCVAMLERVAPRLLSEARQYREVGNKTSVKLPILVSANTKIALGRRVKDLKHYLAQHPQADMSSLSYSLACRKIAYSLRITLQASTVQDLVAGLISIDIPAAAVSAIPKVLVVFAGQGSQYSHMAKHLYAASPYFASILEKADKVLKARGLTTFLSDMQDGRDLTDEATQSAIFTVDFALYQLLERYGVRASAFAGHSLGEYAALACSGVLCFEDALFLVATRARLVVQHCTPKAYGMLAVRASVQDCENILTETHSTCEIACDNAAEQVAISGETTSLDDLLSHLTDAGIKANKLDINFAFHSRAMDDILDELGQAATALSFNAPHTAVYANVVGRVVSAGDSQTFGPTYLIKHARQRVRFREAVLDARQLHQKELGHRRRLSSMIAIEAGADSIVLPMLRNVTMRESQTSLFADLLPCMKKRKNDVETLTATLARLWEANVAVDWRTVFGDLFPAARFISTLPTYPFDDSRFFTPFTDRGLIHRGELVYVEDSNSATPPSLSGSKEHKMQNDDCLTMVEMLGLERNNSATVATFRVIQNEYYDALVRYHSVGDTALAPGTLTGCICQQAAVSTLVAMGHSTEASTLYCRQMHLPGPLAMSSTPRVLHVRCHVEKAEGKGQIVVTCSLTSERGEGAAKITSLHNTIILEEGDADATVQEFASLEPLLLPTLQRTLQDPLGECEVLERALIYNLFNRCVIYGSPYHSIAQVTMKEDVGVAKVELGRGKTMPGYATLPGVPDSLTIDAVGQLPGLICNTLSDELDDDHVFILDSCGRTVYSPRLKELEEARAQAYVLGTCRIEPHEGKGEVYVVADSFAFEETSEGFRLVALMLGSRYHKMRTRTLMSVLKAGA